MVGTTHGCMRVWVRESVALPCAADSASELAIMVLVGESRVLMCPWCVHGVRLFSVVCSLACVFQCMLCWVMAYWLL